MRVQSHADLPLMSIFFVEVGSSQRARCRIPYSGAGAAEKSSIAGSSGSSSDIPIKRLREGASTGSTQILWLGCRRDG